MASDRIRRALPEDAVAICRLNREFNGDDTGDADHIRQCLTAPGPEICYVCESDSELTGFVCGICFASLCYRAPSAQITELYVQKDARRRGVAHDLLQELIAHFRREGVCEVRLETGHDNHAARCLYEKAGFVHDNERTYCLELN